MANKTNIETLKELLETWELCERADKRYPEDGFKEAGVVCLNKAKEVAKHVKDPTRMLKQFAGEAE